MYVRVRSAYVHVRAVMKPAPAWCIIERFTYSNVVARPKGTRDIYSGNNTPIPPPPLRSMTPRCRATDLIKWPVHKRHAPLAKAKAIYARRAIINIAQYGRKRNLNATFARVAGGKSGRRAPLASLNCPTD